MQLREMSNVVSKEAFNQSMKFTLDKLADTVGQSFGPYGSTTFIQKTDEQHIMTKDGHTILRHILFNTPIENAILTVIKQIALNLVTKVGDGSTSSIVASKYIADAINKLESSGSYNVRAKELIEDMDHCVKLIIEELLAMRNVISDDMHEIDKIATISLNNDERLGKIVADLYREVGRDGFIRIMPSDTDEFHSVKMTGFEIDNGYLDPYCINDFENGIASFTNARVLMIDGDLDGTSYINIVKDVMKYCLEREENLVIMAPYYGDTITKYIRDISANFKNRRLYNTFGYIQIPVGGELARNIFDDLATVLDCRYLMKSQNETDFTIDDVVSRLGFAEKVIMTSNQTKFLGARGADSQEVKDRLTIIRSELAQENGKTESSELTIFKLRKRIGMLEANLATLYVGGNSNQEKDTNQYLVDDAVMACKSALKFGYVIGGNIAIPTVVDKILSRQEPLDVRYAMILKVIRDAFLDIYRTILSKAISCEAKINEIIDYSLKNGQVYDLITGEYTNDRIINSVETEIEILKTVVSIITLLKTTNQYLLINANANIYAYEDELKSSGQL